MSHENIDAQIERAEQELARLREKKQQGFFEHEVSKGASILLYSIKDKESSHSQGLEIYNKNQGRSIFIEKNLLNQAKDFIGKAQKYFYIKGKE